jgi:hypothetical protein
MLLCGEILTMFGRLRLREKFEVNVGRSEMKILLFLDASRFPEYHLFYWKFLRHRPIVLIGEA